MTLIDILNSIVSAFPIFSFGERHIDKVLNNWFSFDQEGMKGRWDLYGRLLKNVLEFLDQRFPRLGQCERSAICDLQMNRISEKITRIEEEYALYHSVEARHTF